MADKFIKQINLGTAETPSLYDIYDEYARRRLEGLSNVYSISCQHAGASTNTYVDYITGDTITYSTMAIANTSFNSADETITISKTTDKTTYIVLESKTAAGAYYAVRFLDMSIGDTIYVVENKVGETNIPDRWLSSAVEDTSATFKVLDGKIDLKEYAKKTEAGKAGTYTSSTPSVANTSSTDLGTKTGTASVTYSKAATETGSAGGKTYDTTASSGSDSANTGFAGPTSASGSATVTYKKSDTKTETAGSHTHTVDSHEHNTDQDVVKTITFTANGIDTFNAGTRPDLTIETKSKIAQMASTTAVDVVTNISAAVVSSSATVNTEYDYTDTAFGKTTVVTGYGSFSGGSLNPAATISVVTGVSQTGEAGAHTHAVDSHEHATGVTALTGVKVSASTAVVNSVSSSSTANAITGISAPTATAFNSMAVDGYGVLSFGTGNFVTSVSASSTAAAITGITYTTVTVATDVAANGTASVAGAVSAKTLTAKSAGAHTHSVAPSSTATVVPSYTLTAAALGTASTTSVLASVTKEGYLTSKGTINAVTGVSGGTITSTEKLTPVSIGSASGWSAGSLPTFTQGAKATLTYTTVTVSGTAKAATLTSAAAGAHTHSIALSDATATGTATVAMSSHSHSYNAPANHTHSVTVDAHTHSIELSDATATGTCSVAIGSHTHTLSNHTHGVTIAAVA